jgi:hypothetical protein
MRPAAPPNALHLKRKEKEPPAEVFIFRLASNERKRFEECNHTTGLHSVESFNLTSGDT